MQFALPYYDLAGPCVELECSSTAYPKGYEISPRKSQSVLEIIELEDEVVDSIHSGKCACTVNPPRPATPSAGDLNPERENHLDSAEAYRQHIFRSSATGTSDLVVRVPG